MPFHERTVVSRFKRLSRDIESSRGRVDVHILSTRNVQRLRVGLGWLLAITFIFMSGRSFAEMGELTTESWGFLLLTPLALALALSPAMPWEDVESEVAQWDDEEETEPVSQVSDPENSGFDMPVL